MLNLIEGVRVLLARVGLLIAHNLLDLTGPVNYGGLKALDQILVSHCRVDVSDVFVRNVELGLALHDGGLLGQGCHEFVKVCLKLFLDTIRPLLLGVELRHEVSAHHRK